MDDKSMSRRRSRRLGPIREWLRDTYDGLLATSCSSRRPPRVSTPHAEGIGAIVIVEGTTTSQPAGTASSQIPIEVQEYIIGFLVPASRGALTAALVCRSWYPAAITVLYKSITFSSRPKALTINALSSLAFEHPLVRAQLAATNTVVFQSGSFSSTFPFAFANMMPSLAALQIHDFKEPLHSSCYKAVSQFSSVTKLELKGATLYNLQTLQRLISALRRLETLYVSGLYIKQTPQDDSIAAHRRAVLSPVPVRLRTLELKTSRNVAQHRHYANFIDWLIDESICESLSNLSLHGPLQRHTYPQPLGPDSSALVNEMINLIELVGASLKTLRTIYGAW